MTTDPKQPDGLRDYYRRPRQASTAIGASSWWYANPDGSLNIYIEQDGTTMLTTISSRQIRELIRQLAKDAR